ncbi:hypothetical protein LCGC14_1683300, partial [marine sediment metagenome]
MNKQNTITLDDHDATEDEIEGVFFRATTDFSIHGATATIYAWTADTSQDEFDIAEYE